MPSLELDNNAAAYQIRAYAPGMIQVNNDRFTHSLIISPTQLIENWQPQTIADLTYQFLLPIVALKPSVLLIGTGATLVFPETSVYGELINQGIGVEIMDTRAACRTYNALSAENRNVVAALIIR